MYGVKCKCNETNESIFSVVEDSEFWADKNMEIILRKGNVKYLIFFVECVMTLINSTKLSAMSLLLCNDEINNKYNKLLEQYNQHKRNYTTECTHELSSKETPEPIIVLDITDYRFFNPDNIDLLLININTPLVQEYMDERERKDFNTADKLGLYIQILSTDKNKDKLTQLYDWLKTRSMENATARKYSI